MILECSFINHLAHLGSSLSCIDIIDVIYDLKKDEDRFILSNGHAAMAWYVILMKHGLLTKSDILQLNNHPDRNPDLGIEVSTGSLGHGFAIAIGIALANRDNDVYCVLSDGECSEGIVWEAMRIGIKLG